jgi:hypothetical protein
MVSTSIVRLLRRALRGLSVAIRMSMPVLKMPPIKRELVSGRLRRWLPGISVRDRGVRL